ncbi:MAG: hypothetical protein M1829_003335 [Trizodia sp. TS-e1964]|nr:MAG: hypothetical protein M1829_003335 [Trizodia sp. TS-e1964]
MSSHQPLNSPKNSLFSQSSDILPSFFSNDSLGTTTLDNALVSDPPKETSTLKKSDNPSLDLNFDELDILPSNIYSNEGFDAAEYEEKMMEEYREWKAQLQPLPEELADLPPTLQSNPENNEPSLTPNFTNLGLQNQLSTDDALRHENDPLIQELYTPMSSTLNLQAQPVDQSVSELFFSDVIDPALNAPWSQDQNIDTPATGEPLYASVTDEDILAWFAESNSVAAPDQNINNFAQPSFSSNPQQGAGLPTIEHEPLFTNDFSYTDPQPTIYGTSMEQNHSYHMPTSNQSRVPSPTNSFSVPDRRGSFQDDSNELQLIADELNRYAQPPLSLATTRSGSGGSLASVPRRKRLPGPKADPTKPWIRINKASKGLNARSAKISAFHPETVYGQLPNTPPTRGIFLYTRKGELDVSLRLTENELLEYLYQHPSQLQSAQNTSPRLKLWLQRHPADSARRDPTEKSSCCRFESCPAKDNKIRVGQYRVAFDENAGRITKYDPFINAGYVHLFCLERFLDFPQIVRDFNISTDNRVLQHEPNGINRMALSGAVAAAADKFFRRVRADNVPSTYPNHEVYAADLSRKPHEGTLTHKLNVVKLDDESPARYRIRSNRGTRPTHQTEHLGNIAAMEVARRAAADAKRRKITRGKKRKIWDTDDEEEEENGEDQVLEVQEQAAENPSKRRRKR